MPTVLFLNNNAAHISDLGAVLKQRGHTLLVTSSAEKAKRLLKQMPLDLILAPVDLDGGAVLSILCDLQNSCARVVFFSEGGVTPRRMPDDTVRRAVRLLGATKYFTISEFKGDEVWWQIAEFFPDWTN